MDLLIFTIFLSPIKLKKCDFTLLKNFRKFSKCSGKKEISCGIKAGLDSLKIALAAKKSLNENRVVNFDEIK
ncbi:MAG: hypothetical protein ACJ0P0_00005 [Flavobacteriaceae bacterium]